MLLPAPSLPPYFISSYLFNGVTAGLVLMMSLHHDFGSSERMAALSSAFLDQHRTAVQESAERATERATCFMKMSQGGMRFDTSPSSSETRYTTGNPNIETSLLEDRRRDIRV